MPCKDNISFSLSLNKVNLVKLLRDFSTGKGNIGEVRYLESSKIVSHTWLNKKKQKQHTNGNVQIQLQNDSTSRQM